MLKSFAKSLLVLSAITGQVQAASLPSSYTLTLPPATVDWLMEVLIDHPFKYKEIAPILQAIQQTINQQNSEFVHKQRADLCELEQLPSEEVCGE